MINTNTTTITSSNKENKTGLPLLHASNTSLDGGFIGYAQQLINSMQRAHKPVAEKYRTSLNKFKDFYQKTNIPFSELTPELMEAFEDWMSANVSRNTSSFYMRNLHAIYNKAIDEAMAPQGHNPFQRVYTGVEKTIKRAINIHDIRKIQNCDLHNNPRMTFARDMFMFAFYTRGMSFVDIAYLRQSNLENGYLTYRRSKTAQLLTMKWMAEMEQVVGKYSHLCSSDYLLPILSSTDYAISRRQYRSASHRVNIHLKHLGRLLGLSAPLTMYVARHSWATAAKANHVPISVISRCMGHDSEKTTRIYLDELDINELDKANATVLKSLK